MARARNIKPSLFENELLGSADPLLTILFTSLWCLADKAGRLEDRPLRIKAKTFPYRDGIDCNGLLTELERLGFIQRYEVDGLKLIQVVNFQKHQAPHHTEKNSELPAPQLENRAKPSVPAEQAPAPIDNGENTVPLHLIPDSGLPDNGFTDSLIPDSGLSDPGKENLAAAAGATVGSKKTVPKVEPGKKEAKTTATWEAYRNAYVDRYSVEPFRDATTNTLLSKFIDSVGADIAPQIADFFVWHNEPRFVNERHSITLLHLFRTKVHTDWQLGEQMTPTRARQIEQKQAQAETYSELNQKYANEGR